MSTVKPKQINKFLSSILEITNLVSTGQTYDDITSALETQILTAGNSQNSLPLQVGSNINPGVDTVPGYNYCRLYDNEGKYLYDNKGNKIYGKITFVNGSWILSYFCSQNGIEVPEIIETEKIFIAELPYIYSFFELPLRPIVSIKELIANSIASSITENFILKNEQLTVDSNGNLSELSNNWNGKLFLLIVNGVVYTPYGSNPDITITSNLVIWNSRQVGFPVQSGDSLLALYTSF